MKKNKKGIKVMKQFWLEDWLDGLPYTVMAIIISLLAILNSNLGWFVNIVVTVWSIGFLISNLDKYKKTHFPDYANGSEKGFGYLLSAVLAWFVILSL
ncbi:hypothetical protein [Coleofasciculus chthonoplastes]|uniref:hypothetical protein n=2 Tax=Coleofasciculus chthonoplastes TaxID=64178 RepID=UPI004062BDAC